jgi:hypothetical protein
MSDRVSPANGKRSPAWGTLKVCPACGRCLCFGCHPEGPCTAEPRTTQPQDAPPLKSC